MNDKIKVFLNSVKFGLTIANDYYGGKTLAYKTDKNRVNAHNRYIKDIMARLPDITESELIEAFASAFSGRLSLVNDNIEYTAGQFYNIEVPQAMAWALHYIQHKRKVWSKYDLYQIA
ncbi:hypothetical protein M0R04_15460, partial [Candidatus Dojkabacteria bacterium]|nr:hypothetical protein [Candidatus Dojkabacteria bacterium]